MKSIKKWGSLILVLAIMTAGMYGCGSSKKEDSLDDQNQTVETSKDKNSISSETNEASESENQTDSSAAKSDEDTAGEESDTAQEDTKASGSEKNTGTSGNSSSGENTTASGNNTTAGSSTKTCTISIECKTILNNLGNFDSEKLDVLPDDGVILSKTTVTFSEGESVYDVLQRVCKEKGIQLESSWTPMYNSAYVEGIHNIYEFDCGSTSGWMYSVNGTYPNYGCSRYILKQSDVIEWRYTCSLGKDIGGSNGTSK